MGENPKDKWIKCISTEGSIRGVAIQATELVRSMAERHGLKGAGAQALGEAVIGSLLIASYCKDRERINLNIRGSKGIAQALVDAYPDGAVRGYVVERERDAQLEDDQGPWGQGLLSVLRTKNESQEQPYIGTVPLLTGHLAKDLTFYWVQSEQVPSAVGLAVNLRGDEITAAGGFLVQAMPGAGVKDIQNIEDHLREMHSLAERLAEDPNPMKLLSQIFQSTAFVLLEERELAFRCDCSWDRVKKALLLVGAEELRSMLDQDGGASVRCDFCAKEYQVAKAELERLLENVGKP